MEKENDQTSLTTERLLLRQWKAEDKVPFAALNVDSEVMEHFPATLNRTESDALAGRFSGLIARLGVLGGGAKG